MAIQLGYGTDNSVIWTLDPANEAPYIPNLYGVQTLYIHSNALAPQSSNFDREGMTDEPANKIFSSDEAKEIIKRLALLQVVETTVPLVLRGIDIQRKNRISFWDAIIVAAAGASNCTTILSEDLSHDTIIEGIRIKNPFLPIP